MNNTKLTYSKIISTLALLLTFGMGANLHAVVQPEIVRGHADGLQCAADAMKDELKTHFRGTRKYGKLLSLNAQIKSRAATVERRIKRNPCYKLMKRDLKKLDELACEFTTVFEEALILNARCEGRPIKGDTVHVTEQVVNMSELVECMIAASHGGVRVGLLPAEALPRSVPPRPEYRNPAIQTPGFGSQFEPYRPGIDIAPGELRIAPPGHSVLSR